MDMGFLSIMMCKRLKTGTCGFLQRSKVDHRRLLCCATLYQLFVLILYEKVWFTSCLWSAFALFRDQCTPYDLKNCSISRLFWSEVEKIENWTPICGWWAFCFWPCSCLVEIKISLFDWNLDDLWSMAVRRKTTAVGVLLYIAALTSCVLLVQGNDLMLFVM